MSDAGNATGTRGGQVPDRADPARSGRPRDGDGIKGIRLSPVQRQLWRRGAPPRDGEGTLLVAGPLDRERLRTALATVIREHDILRTTFRRVAGLAWPLQFVGEAELASPTIEDDLPERGAATLSEPGPDAPVVAAALVPLGSNRYHVRLRLPGLCADATTFRVLATELAGALDGAVGSEPGGRLQYGDVSEWLHEIADDPVREEARQFWRARASTNGSRPRLPFERRDGTEASEAGATRCSVAVMLPSDLVAELAARLDVDAEDVLLGCWALLLARCAGQETLIVDVAFNGRYYPELQHVVGPLTRLLPLPVRAPATAGFAQFIRAVREIRLEGVRLQADYVEPGAAPEHDGTLAPPTATAAGPHADPVAAPGDTVAFEWIDVAGEARAGSFVVGVEQVACETEPSALKLATIRTQAGDTTELSFDARHVGHDDAALLCRRLVRLVESAAHDPVRPIADLDLLDDAERTRVLQAFNDTATGPPEPDPVLTAVVAAAARRPHRTAVVSGSGTLSYAELTARSTGLAAILRSRGAGPGTLVGICLERSADAIVAILAALEAGAAYLPLDVAHPSERLAFMLADADVRVVVTATRHRAGLGVTRASIVCLDDPGPGPDGRTAATETIGAEGAGVASSPDDLAYVIYTSGSTGRPKGVQVTHRNLAWSTHARSVRYAEPVGAYLLLSSLAVDSSVAGIFWTLTQGGTLVLPDETASADLGTLASLVERHRITHLLGLPSLYASLLEHHAPRLASLRVAIVAGEACPDRLVAQHAAQLGRALLVNEYGPTEATVWASAEQCRPEAACVTIGRPIPNARLYVLDARGRPTPLGVPGEIYVGGRGVARGYLNRPDLTAERFVPDPFAGEPGARLYRTGDLGRWTHEGRLRFLGRRDHQIKLRGYRVELPEIEAVLTSHPDVRQAAALVVDRPAGPALVAFLAADASLAIDEVRAFAASRLPHVMQPGVFARLDRLPRSPSGKVDRAALAALDTPPAPDDSTAFVPAASATEAAVADLFAELLGRPQMSATDSFFDLGGHSLLAAQLVARARATFDVDLTVRALFDAPSPRLLARELERALTDGSSEAPPPIERLDGDGPWSLSFGQERLWFLAQLDPASAAYVVPAAMRLRGRLDVGALEAALRALVARHGALRSTFLAPDARPAICLVDAGEVTLERVDSCSSIEDARAFAVAFAARPFDLSRGPLVRAALVRLGNDDHLAVLCLHHIISDGWSAGVLVSELARLYVQCRGGPPAALPPPPCEYHEFACWQRRLLDGPRLDRLLAAWRTHLAGAPPVIDLPLDRPRRSTGTRRGQRHTRRLGAVTSGQMRELARAQRATLFHMILAGWAALLARWTGASELCLGTPVAGRSRPELERVVGFFVNTLVLRLDMTGDPTFRMLLARAREEALWALAHQELPFELLVEHLQPARDLSASPLFQVTVAFQNLPIPRIAIDGLAVDVESVGVDTAKYDLGLAALEDGDDLVLSIEYDADLFEQATIDRLLGGLQTLLAAGAHTPDRRVSALPVLAPADRRRLLFDWNASAALFARDHAIHELFEAHARRQPDATCLVAGETRLAYGEVDRRANRLARHLQRLGVGPETTVGLLLDRSPDVVVAILGVLKAGAVYVPLDPAYPAERLRAIGDDARLAVLVSERSRRELMPGFRGHLVLLDVDRDLIEAERDEPLGRTTPPDGLAYVIYTSGSTGQPKGVMIAHASVINLATWQAAEFGITAASRVSQFASYGFDGAVGETFMALLNGATLVMFDRGALDGQAVIEALNRHAITFAVFVPSLLAQMDPAALTGGTDLTIVSVGETCPPDLARAYARHCTFINGYGPTEFTVYSHIWRVPEHFDGDRVPIGAPMSNTRTYLLDEALRPVPIGAVGEIYLSGVGAARGYAGRPALTAERFLPNPFHDAHPGDVGFDDPEAGANDSRAEATVETLELASARDSCAELRAMPASSGAARNDTAVSPHDLLACLEGLDDDLAERTTRFLQNRTADEIAFRGFSRYFLEGVANRFASRGINADVLRRLLPFETFERLRAIDFGFGNREVLHALRELGASVCGIDLSPFFVQRARHEGLTVTMARVDSDLEAFVDETGITPGSYDIALTTMTLDRVARPRRLLENLFAVLKDGGRFAVQTLLPIVPTDDGAVSSPVVYTAEADRITAGRDLAGDKATLVSLLRALGARDLQLHRLPYVVASGDGVQEYTLWAFVGIKAVAAGGDAYTRMYRTGDLGRYTADGALVFLGRRDHQVKLRGCRVELQEIEAVLAAHPEIRAAAVRVAARATGPALVAFVAADATLALDELRAWTAARLPAFMRPATFVRLDALPLTPNGKVDRAALAPLDDGSTASDDSAFEPPGSTTESALADLFAELLARPRVSVTDSFFDLGGHSLLAAQLVARLRAAFQVDLPLRALFDAPSPRRLARELKRALAGTPAGVPVPMERVADDRGPWPLAYGQQRVWFLSRLDPASRAYVVPAAVRLRGRLVIPALERSLTALVERHAALRSTFPAPDGTPVLQVNEPFPLEMERADLSGADPDRDAGALSNDDARAAAVADPSSKSVDALARAVAFGADFAARPFDLARGPLVRAALLRLGEDDHLVLLCMHHIVADGWSVGLLVGDLAQLYRLHAGPSAPGPAGDPSPSLPAPHWRYQDFVQWQRRVLDGARLDDLLAAWRAHLDGAPHVLDLPLDHPRRPSGPRPGRRRRLRLDAAASARLRALARGQRASLFQVILAAWSALLARWTGSTTLCLGTPTAGRPRPELERVVGFFVNTLVLRFDLGGDPSFRTLIDRAREEALWALAHEDLPFELLVDHVQPARDIASSPLFQVMVMMQNTPGSRVDLPGFSAETVRVEVDHAKFDLTLSVVDADAIAFTLEYAADVFDDRTMERLLARFERVLRAVADAPDLRLSQIPILDEAERHHLLVVWNATATAADGALAHQTFERHARRSPRAVAIEHAGTVQTYDELDRRANGIARRLRQVGIGPESRVGVLLERSPDLVATLLGVMKAGGAYVPLDPSHPPPRTNAVVAEASVHALVTTDALAGRLSAACGRLVCLDATEADTAGSASDPLAGDLRVRPDTAAYLMFTSGSTGRPKGVVVPHRALANFLAAMRTQVAVAAEDKLLAVTTIAFDIAALEIFLPLTSGARVIIAPRTTVASGDLLGDLARATRPTLMQATPAGWRLLMDAGWQGDPQLRALCGGEPLEAELAERLRARVGVLWNVYGPTETTIWSTSSRLDEDEPVTIGRPIANTCAYVLDASGQPVPIGAVGELFIAGLGLARGYHGKPALTADAFVPDPFASRPGERMYRTGDLARRLEDGRIVCLGRRDSQLKVRGFRIEAGDVEAALRCHPAVLDAAVRVWDAAPGDRRLVAYVVFNRDPNEARPSTADLRAFTAERLPDYMVPSHFVPLEALPLTANGKLDRRALPPPRGETDVPFAPPQTDDERRIAEAWKTVLGVDRVGLDDHFFELGGHSLLVVRLQADLRMTYADLTVVDLFAYPTVRALAQRIRAMRVAAPSGAADGRAAGERPAAATSDRGTVRRQARSRGARARRRAIED